MLKVVQALTHARGGGNSSEALARQLQELAKVAPQYLTIEPAREGPGSIVRVNRRASTKAVRQVLVKAAAERHLACPPGMKCNSASLTQPDTIML